MPLARPQLTRLPFTLTLAALACSDDGGGGDTNANLDAGLTTLETGADTETSADDSATTNGLKLDLPPESDLPSATSEDCVAESVAPVITSIPVDILLVVDTSFSMGAALAVVETSINVDFAQILEQSGVDYRLIVLGAHSDTQIPICIASPLSGTNCDPPPPAPAITDRYKHYDAETGSGAFLDNIVNWYAIPDKHGFAPGGYQDFLRPGATKVFLGMTDGTSASDSLAAGDAFDSSLLGLNPASFGTPADRRYKLHLVISMAANLPADEPWLPEDPIQGSGASIQQVAVLSSGWRFPLAQVQHFNVLFQEIAEDVVATTPIACEFPIPTPPIGQIDPDTIEIDYFVNGQAPPVAFQQVVNLAACGPESFYITDDMVWLCPESCVTIQADPAAQLDLRYGCDVGFDPQG